MAFYPHFNTQKKRQEHQGLSAASPREFQCVQRKNRFALQKSHIFKKNHSVRKKKPFRLPFCMSDSYLTLSPDVVIIPPTRIQEGHFPACNSWFPRVKPFFCRDFLGFLFVLPVLELSSFLLGAHHASETGYIFNVLSFVRDRQTVTVSVRYFRHQQQIYLFLLLFCE